MRISDQCTPDLLDEFTVATYFGGERCYPWDLSPEDWLSAAEADLQDGESPRNLVNAVCNAKRAIHAQVDFLLFNCRCYRDRASFPEKIRCLEQLGIVAPALLRNYNDLRNTIEHEYESPTNAQARDCIDVARLFVDATKRFLRPLPTMLQFRSHVDNETLYVECDWECGDLHLRVKRGWFGESCRATISRENPAWQQWLSKILRLMSEDTGIYNRC
jgi:hypothetical protein